MPQRAAGRGGQRQVVAEHEVESLEVLGGVVGPARDPHVELLLGLGGGQVARVVLAALGVAAGADLAAEGGLVLVRNLHTAFPVLLNTDVDSIILQISTH